MEDGRWKKNFGCWILLRLSYGGQDEGQLLDEEDFEGLQIPSP
jgi:hypothetical protein